jgi:hypothetical protein
VRLASCCDLGWWGLAHSKDNMRVAVGYGVCGKTGRTRLPLTVLLLEDKSTFLIPSSLCNKFLA